MNRVFASRWMVATATALVTYVTAAAASTPGSGPSMIGFTAAGAASQAALEQRFDAQLNPTQLRDWLKQMSSEANHVGAPHNKQNAEFVLAQMRAWGWNAEIEQFDVLYPTLKHHTLELVAPTKFVASLTEPPIEGDASSERKDGLPPYHEYGADGDVTADQIGRA